MMYDKSIQPFIKQYYSIKEDLIIQNHITIGTLGPKTTSSVQALKFICNNFNILDKCHIKLYDNFELLLTVMQEENILDYILIPNVYENITRFFWNPKLENCFNFIFPTPQYSLVCKDDYIFNPQSEIRIATCHPVEHIINILSNGKINEKYVKKIITSSTTKALNKLLDGKADMAITNETSFNMYKNKNIKYIFDKYNTNIIWCIFRKR